MDNRADQLQRLVDDLSGRLAENFFQTLQVITSMVSLADRFHEGSHSDYVAEKSAQLAKELGMNNEDIFELKIAARLHDIGKIGLEESLLAKNSNEMISSEYKEYAFHPEQGMQILKAHPGFDSIGEIIYQHHERIDGSGFPRGLQYKMIHPAAAIIGIVDTYHNGFYKLQREKGQSASTAKRYSSTDNYIKSTQQRWATIMNFLTRNAGILFDRKAVEIFTEIVQHDRAALGTKIVMRVPVTNLASGMIMMEDFFSSYGLLIASRGETITEDKIKSLVRFAENGEIPLKILVMK